MTPWPRFWNPEPGLTFPLPCHTIILYQIRQFGGACSAAEPRRLGDSGGLPAPSALLPRPVGPNHTGGPAGVLSHRLLAQDGPLRENYLRYLTGRIRFLSGRLQSLVQSGAEGKLARYLLANVREGQLTCAATDLARRLGLSRASLYRAFQSLEESGLISRHGKTISISDPAGLEGFL